jgi:speckle-type POZ protein
MPPTKIENVKVSIAPPQWKSFYFNVQNFKDLPTTRDHYVETPLFTCNGHRWDLTIYPGGYDLADDRYSYVSIYLNHQSEGSITTTYDLMIIDKFGKKKKTSQTTNDFKGMGDGTGWPEFIKRSDILDESQNILDGNGTLTFGVSIKEDSSDVFVPNNPFQKIVLQDLFLNVETADACFEVVCSAEAKRGKKKKKAKASEIFHAHSLILKKCAPMLADLFDLEDNDGKLATATIADVKPDIFRHLLYYVYGGSVAEEDLKTHAKAIIDAADKYSIVNLKLEAEAAYVKSTDMAMDNVMDNLLYADAKNCALIKEAAMNFLAANHYEAAEKISFSDVPGHLMKDLLIAFGRSSNSKKDTNGSADELTTLSVSDLRRKLAEKGLDVDGSREAMIESIKNSAMELDDDDNNGDDDDNDVDGSDDNGEDN